eukprot:6492695-Amphidinium_carterae.1
MFQRARLNCDSNSTACARLHNGTLTKNDAFWEIDVFVLKKLVACGSELLKQKWESGFTEGVNLDEAIVFANKLTQGDAYKWSAQSVQSELSTCAGFLQRLKHNEAIADDSAMTPFVTRFLKTMEERFLVDKVLSEQPSSSTSTSRPTARAVLTELLEAESKNKEHKMEKILPLSVWRHLLTEEERTKTVALRNKLLKTAKEAMPEPKKAAAKPKPNKKQAATTEDAMEAAARALFR